MKHSQQNVLTFSNHSFWSIKMENFSDLVGKTCTNVENIDDTEIVFTLDTGEKYALFHWQDCCESVYVESIVGDLSDLIGTPILVAEEVSNSDPQPGQDVPEYDSFTWTFYKLATKKGYVDIRWYGTSNGHYSEAVYFKKVN